MTVTDSMSSDRSISGLFLLVCMFVFVLALPTAMYCFRAISNSVDCCHYEKRVPTSRT